MKSLIPVLAVFALAVGTIAEDKPKHSAVSPAPRDGDWWTKRHASFNKRVAEGNVDLIFIGDSITHAWENAGKAVWASTSPSATP